MNITTIIKTTTLGLMLTACAGAADQGSDTKGVRGSSKTYALQSANLGADLPNPSGAPLTSGSLIVSTEFKEFTMKLTLVYDLFPSFYHVNVNEEYVDDCGSRHTIGTNDNPNGTDQLHEVHFIDHSNNRCADGPTGTLYANLKVIDHAGTASNSSLYFVNGTPEPRNLTCLSTVSHPNTEVQLDDVLRVDGSFKSHATATITQDDQRLVSELVFIENIDGKIRFDFDGGFLQIEPGNSGITGISPNYQGALYLRGEKPIAVHCPLVH